MPDATILNIKSCVAYAEHIHTVKLAEPLSHTQQRVEKDAKRWNVCAKCVRQNVASSKKLLKLNILHSAVAEVPILREAAATTQVVAVAAEAVVQVAVEPAEVGNTTPLRLLIHNKKISPEII